MKYFLITVFIFSFFNLQAQLDSTQLNANLTAFDFWVGDWELHWMNPDSSFTYGTNLIEKTLDGNVIQENFDDPSSGFKGTSISIYSLVDSSWHQTWADNAGGHFDFYGIIEGEKRIFQTLPKERNDTLIIQRMRFHSIKDNEFIWNWEFSNDEGKTWKLTWQIFYERKQEE